MPCSYANCPTPGLAARHLNPCHDETGKPLPQLPNPFRIEDPWRGQRVTFGVAVGVLVLMMAIAVLVYAGLI